MEVGSFTSSVKVHLEEMEKKTKIKDLDMPQPLSKEELMERAYKQRWRELKIAKMRANVLKNQIARAYEIIENIRFDHLGDTMFREYFVRAKRELESALSDYLLSDSYHEERIEKHHKMTPKEYDKKVNNNSQPQQSSAK